MPDMTSPLLTLAVVVVIVMAIVIVPIVRILNRTGYSGWWALLFFVPLARYLAMWLFAFAEWPGVKPKGRAAAGHF